MAGRAVGARPEMEMVHRWVERSITSSNSTLKTMGFMGSIF